MRSRLNRRICHIATRNFRFKVNSLSRFDVRYAATMMSTPGEFAAPESEPWVLQRHSPYRNHNIEEVTEAAVGRCVKLAGWISRSRQLGGLFFIVLRDSTGSIQLTIEPSGGALNKDAIDMLARLPHESVVSVEGVVQLRPATMVNELMRSGRLEIRLTTATLLNEALSPLPLEINSDACSEELRLKHRHLDLRRPQMAYNLRLRSRVAMCIRNYLAAAEFIEVETPTLFKSTPEGAREFIVPTRQAGKFYALPQSPQQYKQLLIAGGVERYFQLARCYRDESGRADRQPEFTQIDLEVAFATPETIMSLVEGLVKEVWKVAVEFAATSHITAGIPPLAPLPADPLPRVSYHEAMSRYGVDKPDRRIGMPISDVSGVLRDTVHPAFRAILDGGGSVRAMKAPGMGDVTRKVGDSLTPVAQQMKALSSESPPGASSDHPARDGSVTLVRVSPDGSWKSPLAKLLSPEEVSGINAELGAKPGDLLMLSSGWGFHPCRVLGHLRTHCAVLLKQRGHLSDLPPWDAMWVVDFPLLEPSETMDKDHGTGLQSTHHPFTAPAEHADVFENSHSLARLDRAALLAVRAQHYDLVVNGVEVGGGSIRIHNSETQKLLLRDVLGLKEDKLANFSHLLQALSHGCPPHGGMALGLDRLLSLLVGASSVRDVIAFPKSAAGNELMTGSPSAVTPEQLKEYSIATKTA